MTDPYTAAQQALDRLEAAQRDAYRPTLPEPPAPLAETIGKQLSPTATVDSGWLVP